MCRRASLSGGAPCSTASSSLASPTAAVPPSASVVRTSSSISPSAPVSAIASSWFLAQNGIAIQIRPVPQAATTRPSDSFGRPGIAHHAHHGEQRQDAAAVPEDGHLVLVGQMDARLPVLVERLHEAAAPVAGDVEDRVPRPARGELFHVLLTVTLPRCLKPHRRYSFPPRDRRRVHIGAGFGHP